MHSVNNFKFKSIPLDLPNIAFDMAEGSLTELKEIFFIEGKYAPIIRWCSFPQSDWPKPHQIICEFWRDNSTTSNFTPEAIEENAQLLRVKPYLAFLTKKDNDFVHDIVGDRYQAFHNLSDNPKSLLDQLNDSQSAIDLLQYTSLLAASIRGQGLLCMYQGGTDTKPELWNKLILPVHNNQGVTEKFVICALKSPS